VDFGQSWIFCCHLSVHSDYQDGTRPYHVSVWGVAKRPNVKEGVELNPNRQLLAEFGSSGRLEYL
jgi:hypothetical protein